MSCLSDVCEKCKSETVFLDEAAPYLLAPHCLTCGRWYHTPDEPPLVDNHQANRAAKLKAWVERQEANGMCRNCCEPIVEGYKYCADHLEFHQSRCEEMRKAS